MQSAQKRLTLQRGLKIPGILGMQKNLAESVIKVIKGEESPVGMLPFFPGVGTSPEGPALTADGKRELIEEEIVVEDKSLEAMPDDLLLPPTVSPDDESPKSLS